MYNRFGDCLHTNIGKLLLSCTFKYFYYDETKHEICSLDSKEDFVKFKNNKQNKKYFDKKPFLIDTYIEPTIEDYILKKDPILEYAEKSLKTCRKNNH